MNSIKSIRAISIYIVFLIYIGTLNLYSATGPNIILVFMDDMGYNDMSVSGAPHIETPNLDQMAAEGTRFTSFYSGSAICSPSRAALLTGSYPRRVGLTRVMWPRDNTGLNPNEISIAQVIKTRGYATACIGKWHVGHKERFLPTSHGFDYYYGIPYSNDMTLDPASKVASDILLLEGYTTQTFNDLLAQTEAQVRPLTKNKVPLFRNEEIIEFPADQATVTQRYTDETINFAKTHKDSSFFIYLAHTMPHTPLFVTAPFVNSNPKCADIGANKGCGLYADVIEEMDHNMGRLGDSLKAFGIDNNTLIVFTSDNGPWSQKPAEQKGSADPFRGAKFQNWEGGMREPFIARWPGTIPAGSVQNGMAALIDLLPTFAKLSNPDMGLPRNRVIDGKDISAMLLDANAPTPHNAFFYDRNQNVNAVRSGDWKLRDGALYDLANDIHEDTDLSGSNTAKAAELQALIDAHTADMNNNGRPIGNMNTVILTPGCTDVAATNYDNNAELDDGSCWYGPLEINKEISRDLPYKIKGNSIFIKGEKPFTFEIVDIQGRIVFQKGGRGSNNYSLDFPHSQGLFLVQFNSEGNRFFTKTYLY